MRAIEYIELAYVDFPLRDKFVEVDRQILREATVAEVSLKSDSLKLMIKLFVSEMEGEGGLYVGYLGNGLGYREEGNWISPWKLKDQFKQYEIYDNTPLDKLHRMNYLEATCDVQLRCELEWFVLNLQIVVDYFNGSEANLPNDP